MRSIYLIACLLVCTYTMVNAGPTTYLLSVATRNLICEHSRDLNLTVSDTIVYFYDFPNVVKFTINQAAQEILKYKSLNKAKKFNVFVGGFTSQINDESTIKIRDAFRNFKDGYLIILDHSSYTHYKDGILDIWKDYDRSVKYVHYIGKELGQMLAQLKAGGISPKNIHCTGHSLGGHISGHAGETFLNKTGEKLGRITALDPAGPCFTNSSIQEQVRSGVAEYVEVYHCNAGKLGTLNNLGDINFYVNEGTGQPQCPGLLTGEIKMTCDHSSCVDMWKASVLHRDWFSAHKCDMREKFNKEQCPRNTTIKPGFWNPGNAKGIYYFSTEKYDFEKDIEIK